VVTNLGQFGGRVVAVDLVVGETLIAARLVDPASLSAPGTVPAPEGMQEFSVTFAPEQAVGGRVAAGDTVGIYLSWDGGVSGAVEPSTQHVFHRVLVTSVQGVDAVDEGAADAAALPGGSVNITFATSVADAERIIYADQNMVLWLSLETEDDMDDGSKVVTYGNVFQ
jgi:pilus assembly protein CpaB